MLVDSGLLTVNEMMILKTAFPDLANLAWLILIWYRIKMKTTSHHGKVFPVEGFSDGGSCMPNARPDRCPVILA